MTFKFFLNEYKSIDEPAYQFIALSMAEGFLETGTGFWGNIDYWFDSDRQSCTIKKNDAPADVHIYESAWFEADMSRLASVDYSRINILLDYEDRLQTPCIDPRYQRFNYILRTHYTRALNYPANVVPWAFGLTNRIIRGIEAARQLAPQPSVLISYRVFHDIRKIAEQQLLPLLEPRFSVERFIPTSASEADIADAYSYWNQTGRRHDDAYFKALNSALLCFAFGGTPGIKPIYNGATARYVRQVNKLMLQVLPAGITANLRYVIQYDSWRFWEALLSNSCPVHIDLDYWQAVLPVMPVNGQHYIGLKGLGYSSQASAILSCSDEQLLQIGRNGKEWVLENYSPAATARRILNLVENGKR